MYTDITGEDTQAQRLYHTNVNVNDRVHFSTRFFLNVNTFVLKVEASQNSQVILVPKPKLKQHSQLPQ